MDEDKFKEDMQRMLDEAPRIPGVDWALALHAVILDTLEDRFPGFKDDVRKRLERSAARMEASDNPDSNADAPSVRELIASWVLSEERSSGRGEEDR